MGFLEIATLGVPGGGLTSEVATELSGQRFTTDTTEDSSSAGFTATSSFMTPRGAVEVMWGGELLYDPDGARTGQTGVVNGNYEVTSSTDPNISEGFGGAYHLFGDTSGLQYTDFGYWTLSRCANGSLCSNEYIGTIGGARSGVAETQDMPTTGSATFTGNASGFVLQPIGKNSRNWGDFYGDAELMANFGTGEITGGVTGIDTYKASSPENQGTVNDIEFAGMIDGSTFAGTATADSTAGTAFDIAGATGTFNGAFYGPGAAEAAGAFTVNGGPNETALQGSFGVAQTAP